MNALNLFEIPLLNRLYEIFGCPFCDAVMPVITFIAEKGIGCILFAAILLCFKKTRKAGWMIGVALILGLALGNGVLKNVIARTRPYDIDPDILTRMLVWPLKDYSFPSGHALACFEVAGVLLMTEHRNRMGWAWLAVAVLVSFSRLYLGVHYPTDVLAGAALGILFAWFGVLIVSKVYALIEKKRGVPSDSPADNN